MKKLIISLAMVAVATISAQAATTKWSIGNGSTQVKFGDTILAGQAIQLYLVGVDSADDLLWDSRALSNTPMSKGKLSSTFGETQTGTYDGTYAGGAMTKKDDEGKFVDLGREYYYVMTYTDGDKTYKYTSSALPSSGLDDKNMATLNFSYNNTIKESGTDGWVAQSVPEPTSGLLLLLGVAGLALKRRRA